MMPLQPLPAAQLPLLRPLLGHPDALPELGYALEAAIAGGAPLTAWVDDPARPALAYLCDLRALHYLLGARTPAAAAAVARLLADELLPTLAQRARAAGEPAFALLRYADAAWGHDGALAPLAGLAAHPRVAHLRPPHAPLPAWAAPERALPAGYRLVSIDAALLNDATLQLDSLRREIAEVWPTPATFLAHAWGYGVLWGQALVAWCTAEEVSPGRCGVGIWTAEAHRRRGLATAAAAAFARRCAREGRTALWDAWAANEPSRRVAERLGWALQHAYTVRVGPVPAG